MKPVMREIFQLKRDYTQLPFFDFLRDTSLSARQRMAFYPCMAPFIMSFGDLNRFVMRSEPTNDKYQEMVNAHTYEDDHHWPWYLEDFIKLGFDQQQHSATQWLNFIYGDETIQNRLLAHKLAHLIYGSSSVVKLAIIEAIEETGNVLFSSILSLAETIESELSVELRYCGMHHFSKESGHAMNNDHAILASITLDDNTRAEAIEKSRLVFEWFTDWTTELLTYAKAHPYVAHDIAHNPAQNL